MIAGIEFGFLIDKIELPPLWRLFSWRKEVMISVYSKKTEIEVTSRRLEQMEKYNKIIQYGRQNPVWFCENILKIELLDFQKMVIMNSWRARTVCWVCSRNAGKTFLGAIYIMMRAMLLPYSQIYLLNISARQSQDTFL